MKFQDAFNAAFDERAKVDKERGREFVMQASTLKILAFAWNMLAVAQNKLDDTVIIGDNNEIISVPFKNKKEKSENTSSAEKTSDKVEDNGEKEPKETTEPEPEKPTEE